MSQASRADDGGGDGAASTAEAESEKLRLAHKQAEDDWKAYLHGYEADPQPTRAEREVLRLTAEVSEHNAEVIQREAELAAELETLRAELEDAKTKLAGAREDGEAVASHRAAAAEHRASAAYRRSLMKRLARTSAVAVPHPAARDIEDMDISSGATVCTCSSTTEGEIVDAIRKGGLTTVAEIEAATQAGGGCGGCVPEITQILDAELKKMGKLKPIGICPAHFPDHSRPMLFDIVKVRGFKTFDEVYDALATKPEGAVGRGCDVCKTIIGNLLASVHNDFLLTQQSIQDTNDRYLANMQRGGTFSVIPRLPAGELTPEILFVLGEIARDYGLYTKITSQRIGLFGVQLQDMPTIWRRLGDAGFEPGTAYGKALRNVKACIGVPWCPVGVGRSTDLAVLLEHRYKNIRSPHKLKGGVSACSRDCGEAKAKDFGAIAVGDGNWTVFVGGNAGQTPRHADILVANVDQDTAVRYIDRFLMYYIRTASFGQRTSHWLTKMEGGIDHLRSVVVEDSLGLGAELEEQMAHLVEGYQDEWQSTLSDPLFLRTFREFGGDGDGSAVHTFSPAAVLSVGNRGHMEPGGWPPENACGTTIGAVVTELSDFRMICLTDDVSFDQGMNFIVDGHQIAVFRLRSTEGAESWRAIQSKCPHRGDNVLHRGITGVDERGAPTVACPCHKKRYSLDDGVCLKGGRFAVRALPGTADSEL